MVRVPIVGAVRRQTIDQHPFSEGSLSAVGGAASGWEEYDTTSTHRLAKAAIVGGVDTVVNYGAEVAGEAVGVAAATWLGAEEGAAIGAFAGPLGAVAGVAIAAAVGAGIAYLADGGIAPIASIVNGVSSLFNW